MVHKVKGVATEPRCKEDTPELVIEEYADVIESMGELPGIHRIEIHNDAEPSAAAPGNVPLVHEGA